jgi:FlaA1/EpsC-like NDP-sugar epimerase
MAGADRGRRAVKVTSPECTRFWMGREEAAKLVVDTLVSMAGGEVAIPDLPAFQLGDLVLAMRAQCDVVALVTGRSCTNPWTKPL